MSDATPGGAVVVVCCQCSSMVCEPKGQKSELNMRIVNPAPLLILECINILIHCKDGGGLFILID